MFLIALKFVPYQLMTIDVSLETFTFVSRSSRRNRLSHRDNETFAKLVGRRQDSNVAHRCSTSAVGGLFIKVSQQILLKNGGNCYLMHAKI